MDEEIPVSVGDVLNVTINNVGSKGDGVCNYKGFILFVANAKVGDAVSVKVTHVKPRYGFAVVVSKRKRVVVDSEDF